PVELLGPIDGIWFRSTHEDRVVVLACEMALRLPTLTRILKRHGVRGVEVLSSYRDRPEPSFHTMGLGLDLPRFWTRQGWLSVLDHFQETPAQETCADAEPPEQPRARTLLSIACAL